MLEMYWPKLWPGMKPCMSAGGSKLAEALYQPPRSAPGRGQAGRLAERLQQRVFIHGEQGGVLLPELFQERAAGDRYVGVAGRTHEERWRVGACSTRTPSSPGERLQGAQSAQLQKRTAGQCGH